MGDHKLVEVNVVTVADSIQKINNQIRDGFSNVQTAMSQLDNSWDGAASANSISKFNEIKSKFVDTRYSVMILTRNNCTKKKDF